MGIDRPALLGTEAVSAHLRSATATAVDQMAPGVEMTFRAFDLLQRNVWSLASGFGLADRMVSIVPFSAVLDFAMRSVEFLGLFSPPREEAFCDWTEFDNKLRVYRLFENVQEAMALPDHGLNSLAELVRRAGALGNYDRVWATEGAGHYFAGLQWDRCAPLHNLLSGPATTSLPAQSLIPLHVGMGTAFATRSLEGIRAGGNPNSLGPAVERFVQLCRSNSRPGYAEAALEPLGLVVRNLFPDLVLSVDRELVRLNSGCADLFWHGVGRALYFAPAQFVPCGSERWRAAWTVPPVQLRSLARLNAEAGLVWAVTLVNIRHPAVVESLWNRLRSSFAPEAFANGLASALMAWEEMSPDDGLVRAFSSYRFADRGGSSPAWRNHVSPAIYSALHRVYPEWRKKQKLGQMFRFWAPPAEGVAGK